MDDKDWTPRRATPEDADEVTRLLHDFNTEFDTPSPGVAVLAPRLRRLLAGNDTLLITRRGEHIRQTFDVLGRLVYRMTPALSAGPESSKP